MKLDEPLINLRLLYLYENYLHNFCDGSKYVAQALNYSLAQIKSKSFLVKKAAIASLIALIKINKVYVPINTFEELALIAKQEVSSLLKFGTLSSFLEAIVTLLPTWDDEEDRVDFFSQVSWCQIVQ